MIDIKLCQHHLRQSLFRRTVNITLNPQTPINKCQNSAYTLKADSHRASFRKWAALSSPLHLKRNTDLQLIECARSSKIQAHPVCYSLGVERAKWVARLHAPPSSPTPLNSPESLPSSGNLSSQQAVNPIPIPLQICTSSNISEKINNTHFAQY